MTRNSDDLKKQFENSLEKQLGRTYEQFLERELQKAENMTEEYRKFAERLSLEINRRLGEKCITVKKEQV